MIVISHRRRVRACLIQGPRGYKGFNGPTGKTGRKGNGAGAPGLKPAQTGPTGPNGTARAYVLVQPTSPTAANLIGAFNITSVTEPLPGVYCITPAAGVSTASGIAAVSPEVSYSAPEAPGVIAVNAQRKNCPATPSRGGHLHPRSDPDARHRLRVHNRRPLTRRPFTSSSPEA